MPRRRTDDQPQPNRDRRAEGRDGDILAPRTESELIGSALPAAPRSLAPGPADRFEPPVSAIAPLFRLRLERIYRCRVSFHLDINTRPTTRVLGGYYKSRRLVRIYSHDSNEGRRSLEELFDTFLHELAHHLEYTESHAFASGGCRRVPGLMHSRLFWRILGTLKQRWGDYQLQRRC
jgi:hypothetical protein